METGETFSPPETTMPPTDRPPTPTLIGEGVDTPETTTPPPPPPEAFREDFLPFCEFKEELPRVSILSTVYPLKPDIPKPDSKREPAIPLFSKTKLFWEIVKSSLISTLNFCIIQQVSLPPPNVTPLPPLRFRLYVPFA